MHDMNIETILNLIAECKFVNTKVPNMRYFLLTGIMTLLSIGIPASGKENKALEHSLVKIYATMQNANYSMPWQGHPPQSGNGTGFIIKGNRILSNAHVVSNSRFIEVKKNNDPRRYSAHVKFAAHDCDLAILEVDDPTFFNNTKPVKFAKTLPQLSDTVTVIGYPMGGALVSLTKGVVSRIDYSGYSHSGVDKHLVLQVDAAINPGNSGGPVLLNDKVVGVAFQGITQASNIGYVIPVPIIDHFLTDIKDGKYHGYPELGAFIMNTRNAALRESLGLCGDNTGPVVYYIDPFGSAKDILQPNDVLLEIDNRNIAEDGTINLSGNSIDFSELIERKQWGDKITLKVLRDKTIQQIEIPLTNPEDPYIFRNIYDQRPEYCILGGLVFSPLSRNYLRTIGRNLNGANQQQLLYATQYAKLDGLYKDRTQFVVLIRRLPHTVNSYTGKFLNGLVTEVNGIHIRNISDMQKAIESPTNGYHTIRFVGMDDYIVLDANKTKAAEAQIMARYAIPTPFFIGEKNK